MEPKPQAPTAHVARLRTVAKERSQSRFEPRAQTDSVVAVSDLEAAQHEAC